MSKPQKNIPSVPQISEPVAAPKDPVSVIVKAIILSGVIARIGNQPKAFIEADQITEKLMKEYNG